MSWFPKMAEVSGEDVNLTTNKLSLRHWGGNNMTQGHRFRSNMLMEHFTIYCSGKKKKWESIGFTLNILPLED